MMADQEYVSVAIQVTTEQRQKIEELAHRRGYSAADDYLRALIERDAKAQGENLILDDEDETDPVESFRQAWHEIMSGQTYPISTLWDDMEDDE